MHDEEGDAALARIVTDVVASVLDLTEADLREQPVLANHDWDSLTTLEALAQLESAFSISLDLRTYHAARTLDDLIGVVRDAVAAQNPAAAR